MESRRQWILPNADPETQAAADNLCESLGLPRAIGRLLSQRGCRDVRAAERLLNPRTEHLHDPGLMADMDTAAERLVHALRHDEHIVVNGDYDTDGITGTTLLVSELRRLGARIDFFIPDRERDGYGVTPRLVKRAGEVGVRVMITVDCGSSDHEAIAQAREAGIDVIVVDHHEIPERPAAACAVLNPKRADCGYPFKGLSAVGVAYKLLQAVCTRLSHGATPEDGLDLVVLGTLADIQPVVDENRVLTALGLQRLRSESLRPGVRALLSSAGVRGEQVRSGHVGFRMVPRINAVGRVARGKMAVDLLLARDDREAWDMALAVEGQNERRRHLQEFVVEEARAQAADLWKQRERAALAMASERWHPGVVGIAAARLVDDYGVPVALVGIQNGVGKGSVRTVPGVNVRAALDAASELLVKYGGHREACGLTIEPQHVDAFAERFEAAVREQQDSPDERSYEIDVELDADDLGLPLLDGLDRLEPFGTGNREPLFLFQGLRVGERTRIVGQGHLKLDLELPTGRRLDGIAFGWGRDVPPADIMGVQLDAVGHVRRQDPRFGDDCQLVVSDLRTHATAQVP